MQIRVEVATANVLSVFPARYKIEPGEFDQGVGCLIRVEEGAFEENSIQVQVLDQLQVKFDYGDSEEIIGNFISISPATEDGDHEFRVRCSSFEAICDLECF